MKVVRYLILFITSPFWFPPLILFTIVGWGGVLIQWAFTGKWKPIL